MRTMVLVYKNLQIWVILDKGKYWEIFQHHGSHMGFLILLKQRGYIIRYMFYFYILCSILRKGTTFN